jgi:exodeoxyribonuclease VII large subunit
VVSVESGKGYADFMSIVNSVKTYRLHIQLFPALMMGPEAAVQMSAALEKIRERAAEFDAVCIIRGGGGENTLQCFNDLTLCRAIALFPLPVMTGIGHATNRTVAEEVASTSFVSPSELANFLIDRHSGEVARFNVLTNKIALLLQRNLQNKTNKLDMPIKNLRYKYGVVFRRKKEQIEGAEIAIRQKIDGIFTRRAYAIHAIASRIALAAGGFCQRQRQRVEGIEECVHGAAAIRIPVLAGRPLQMRLAAEPSDGVCILRGTQIITSISVLRTGDKIRIVTPEGAVSAEITATDIVL